MATRYWVGGTGTWDASSTANWSLTTGGASGASAPTSADTVIFDSLSGTGTCTTASGSACATATLNSSTLNLTLGANHTMSGTFTLTLGTLSFESFVLTCNVFNSNNSNTRIINFGTGRIDCTANAVPPFVMNAANNFTFTGTSNVNLTYNGSTGTRIIAFGSTSGGTAANVLNVNIIAGSDIFTIQNGSAFRNLNFTGFSGTLTNTAINTYGDVTFSSGMTCTAGTSALSFLGASTTQKVTLNNNSTVDFPVIQNKAGGTVELQDNFTIGSTRTFTLTNGILDLTKNGTANLILSTGLFASTNTNTRSILFGTGNITVKGSGTVWNTSSTTGFSYTGTPTINISNNSATATTVSTGSMTEAQSLNFNYTVGSYTLTDTSAVYKSLNFTGFTGTIPNSVRTIYGGATFVSGMTLTAGANATTFAATSGANNITTAQTWDFPITVFGLGGTFIFQDALTMGSTRTFTITAGTVNFKAGTTNTVGSFITSGSNQKYLGSSTVGSQATISDASGVNSVSKLTIQDSLATGGATWSAFYGNGNIDGGNNTNWDFGESPVLGNEYEYKLRSMTERRRF
jgi:hypothetical protein